MAVAEGGGIFVSYRREESSHFAGRLSDRLAERFGERRVFIDVDAIEAGADWAEAIDRAVGECAVLLAVIGPRWLAAVDQQGRRRLDNPDDIVRVEIGTALARGVRVIPVLVEGAVMPARDELPEDLAGLARRQGVTIRYESFRADAGRLIDAIERILAALEGAGQGGTAGERATELFLLAEGIAGAINDADTKAQTLVKIASALAAIDARRADQLLTDAENLTRRHAYRETTLREIAITVAAIDPERAENLARSLASKEQAKALIGIAAVVAAAAPGRANRLFTDAENLIRSLNEEDTRTWMQQERATAMSVDPGRADDIEDYLTHREDARAWALYDVVAAMSTAEPDRAEDLARSLTSRSAKAWALAAVAAAMAGSDPRRAEYIANSLTSPNARTRALCDVAAALVASRGGRASRLFADALDVARSLVSKAASVRALCDVAAARAATDAGFANGIFTDAENLARSLTDELDRSYAVRGVATAVAASDPGRAENIARRIGNGSQKTLALRDVAIAVATADPERAEAIARSISYEPWKAVALSGVARVLAGRGQAGS